MHTQVRKLILSVLKTLGGSAAERLHADGPEGNSDVKGDRQASAPSREQADRTRCGELDLGEPPMSGRVETPATGGLQRPEDQGGCTPGKRIVEAVICLHRLLRSGKREPEGTTR